MSPGLLLEKIKNHPADLVFAEVLAAIDDNYIYTPTKFRNGVGDDAVVNEAGTNQGSCKVFAFARFHQLSEQETLACFAEHYRDVLADPQGTGHANIRRFMCDGWANIVFDEMPLQAR